MILYTNSFNIQQKTIDDSYSKGGIKPDYRPIMDMQHSYVIQPMKPAQERIHSDSSTIHQV